MTIELKENGGIPRFLLLTLAIIAGLAVANLYYAQPLLNMIKDDLKVTTFEVNFIPMLCQIGYAAGVLFIVPLGDLLYRKKIILTNFAILVVSLLAIAFTKNMPLILIASFLSGICSVTPQIFIPIAAQFSRPEKKSSNVGIVLSGLLTGILMSRVISGIVGEHLGWREMYYIATFLMILCFIAIQQLLPDIPPTFNGRYMSLMKSIYRLLRTYRQLITHSTRAALAFGSFTCMWACMAFKIKAAPFFAGSDVVGLLGLCGLGGVMTASLAGKYIPLVGVRNFHYIGCSFSLLAWAFLYFGGNTYVGLVIGVVLIDIGMQCIQLSNQSSLFALCPPASNRINTIFMTIFFLGGSLGTFLAGSIWQSFEWNGIISIGVGLVVASVIYTLCTKE
jgi:predicted MFS family arabinose efflux permease